MAWWILLSVVAFLVITLLYAPVRVHLDSINNNYYASWGDVIFLSIRLATDDIFLDASFFGLTKAFSMVELVSSPKKKKREKRKAKNDKVAAWFFNAILKSIRIKRFYLNIDFHSVFWNAWLYPLGYIFSRPRVTCRTNFEGKNEIVLDVMNRPIWLVNQVIKQQVKTSNHAKRRRNAE